MEPPVPWWFRAISKSFRVTAFRVAVRRAAHQLLDRPLVRDDPIALRVIGPETAAMLRADPAGSQRSPLDGFLRASMVARSRYAEDILARAVGHGLHQYVLLGAGLDPGRLAHLLRDAGFHELEDLDGDAINRRHFADREDGLRVGGAGRLCWASV